MVNGSKQPNENRSPRLQRVAVAAVPLFSAHRVLLDQSLGRGADDHV